MRMKKEGVTTRSVYCRKKTFFYLLAPRLHLLLYNSRIATMVNPRVFFDIDIDGRRIGRQVSTGFAYSQLAHHRTTYSTLGL